jgi:hypothetical protein
MANFRNADNKTVRWGIGGDVLQRSNISLILGIASICLAVVETLTGEGLGGYGRMLRRSDDPAKFWRLAAIHYAVGVLGIGYFLLSAR